MYRDPSANICQLRLDFDTFRLAQPDNVSGQCTTDAFSVSGVVNAVPVICGENSGSHSKALGGRLICASSHHLRVRRGKVKFGNHHRNSSSHSP